MKSNIEKVYSKLPQKKHSLSKHKVELKNAQELEKLTNDADQTKKEFEDILNSWYDRYIDVWEDVNSIINLSDIYSNKILDLENALDEFGSSAEDLGVNPFQFDEYTNATTIVGDYQSNLDINKEVLDVAKSIKQI